MNFLETKHTETIHPPRNKTIEFRVSSQERRWFFGTLKAAKKWINSLEEIESDLDSLSVQDTMDLEEARTVLVKAKAMVEKYHHLPIHITSMLRNVAWKYKHQKIAEDVEYPQSIEEWLKILIDLK